MAYKGNLKTETLPSGRIVSFREQDGGDDEILSKIGDAGTGDNITKFVRSLVKKVGDTDVHLTLADIDAWPVKDKYSLLIKSRIFSLGSDLEFTHKCSKCGMDSKCTENLDQFDWDYSKPFPEKFLEDGKINPVFQAHVQAPRPYDMAHVGDSGYVHLTLSSKKEVRYKYLDGAGEKLLLDRKEDSLSKLLEMQTRGLQWKDETSQYITVQDYRIFSARDMMEIRTSYMTLDEPFQGISELPCTNPKCNQRDITNIIVEPVFFFPVAI